jgi:hypothetical protein
VRLEKRIRTLEARMLSDPVILFFRDGSMGEIHGPPNFLLDLLVRACGGADLTPAQSAQLDLIRQSAYAQEPGGARMTELIRCFLHSPAEQNKLAAQLRAS